MKSNQNKKSFKNRIFYFILFHILLFSKLYSQNDCTDAIITCGNGSFNNLSVSGPGSSEINSCGGGETNSLWIKVNIKTAGTLGFLLTPESSNIGIDFDFYVFGPTTSCNNLGNTVRCSTTNPIAANSASNITGMNDTENDTSEGPGAAGNNFVKSLDVLPGETYYFVIDRFDGDSNFSMEWTGTATFNEPPTINNTTGGATLNIEKCDSDAIQDNTTSFDLTNNSILAIGTQVNIIATFHTTENDAIIGINPIATPSSFINTVNPQTIYILLENSISNCFSTTEFNLNVTPFESVDPNDLQSCDMDGNGFETFNLSDNNLLLIDGNSDLNVTYFKTNSNAIPLPNSYTNQVAFTNEIIWAKVTNTTTGCFIFKSFNLIVNPLPTIISAQLSQCDIGLNPDGLTIFNLSEANAVLTNNDPNLTTYFYLNQTDVNEVSTNFTNTSNPQTLAVKVINLATGCFIYTTLTLNVSTNPSINVVLKQCDIDGIEDGFTSFNLTNTGLETAGNTVVYYLNSNDALLEQNPLNINFTNTIVNQQTIFARIENANSCIGINSVNLIVNPLPDFDIQTTNVLCANITNQPAVLKANVLNGNSIDFQYLWHPNGETTPEIATFTPGIYSVDVTDMDSCTKTKNITISSSDIAQIQSINIVDFSDNNSIQIIVTGAGNYQYSIDNSSYQESNIFTNIAIGIHTIYIKDTNGCGIVEREIYVLGAPSYFSPNGDGINDYWNIKGCNLYPTAVITIYDRFGKLLSQFNVFDKGWDGTLNQVKQVSDDYWYYIQFNDSRSAKGHFTLKR